MNELEQKYMEGFKAACARYGIAPEELVKQAYEPLGPAEEPNPYFENYVPSDEFTPMPVARPDVRLKDLPEDEKDQRRWQLARLAKHRHWRQYGSGGADTAGGKRNSEGDGGKGSSDGDKAPVKKGSEPVGRELDRLTAEADRELAPLRVARAKEEDRRGRKLMEDANAAAEKGKDFMRGLRVADAPTPEMRAVRRDLLKKKVMEKDKERGRNLWD